MTMTNNPKTYPFIDNPKWILYSENDQWGKADPSAIVKVLESIKESFEATYGYEYVNKRKLDIRYHEEVPVTYPNEIFLNIKNTAWCQLIYQFSHELCHLMIMNDKTYTVVENLRWFEESICELSSQYFLLKLAEKWKKNSIFSDPDYGEKIKNYYENNKATNVVSLNGEAFNTYINRKLSHLAKNYYERDINRLCANHMLQYFIDNPKLWLDVLKLSKIPSNLSFMDSLYCWKDLSDNKDSIDKIINLFKLPD